MTTNIDPNAGGGPVQGQKPPDPQFGAKDVLALLSQLGVNFDPKSKGTTPADPGGIAPANRATTTTQTAGTPGLPPPSNAPNAKIMTSNPWLAEPALMSITFSIMMRVMATVMHTKISEMLSRAEAMIAELEMKVAAGELAAEMHKLEAAQKFIQGVTAMVTGALTVGMAGMSAASGAMGSKQAKKEQGLEQQKLQTNPNYDAAKHKSAKSDLNTKDQEIATFKQSIADRKPTKQEEVELKTLQQERQELFTQMKDTAPGKTQVEDYREAYPGDKTDTNGKTVTKKEYEESIQKDIDHVGSEQWLAGRTQTNTQRLQTMFQILPQGIGQLLQGVSKIAEGTIDMMKAQIELLKALMEALAGLWSKHYDAANEAVQGATSHINEIIKGLNDDLKTQTQTFRFS